jgi:signal peptidase II
MDWYTKNWATSLISSHHFGFLHFELVYNHGVMLGFFSQLPLLVKMVTLTTFGAMVLCSYFMVIALVPIKSLFLRAGLPILVGGIMGNVTDRFIRGMVVDFIAFNFNLHSTPIMNMADICQWIGCAGIAFGLYQDAHYYWPTQDWRKTFFINPQFQIRTSLIMSALSFVTGFIILVFGLSFFQNNFAQANSQFYLIYGSALILFLSLSTFVISLILSHRIAGPVFALKRYLNDSCQGKISPFNFRENDEFKEELETQLVMLNAELQRLYEIEKNQSPSIPSDKTPSKSTKKVA